MNWGRRARLSIALLILGVACAPAPVASAAAWSKPAKLTAPCPFSRTSMTCAGGPAPVIALDAHGGAVVAWNDQRRSRVGVALARRAGRFGRPMDLGRGIRPAVALANGRATVVWANGRGLYFSRAGAAGHFSAPRRLAAPIATVGNGGDDDPQMITQPDGSVIVVIVSSFADATGKYRARLRAVTISPSGQAGPARDLGSFTGMSAGTGPGGRAVVCCVGRPLPVGSVVNDYGARAAQVFTPGVGWQLRYLPLTLWSVQSAAVGDGPLAFGTMDLERHGSWIVPASPGVIVSPAIDVFGPSLKAGLIGPTTRGQNPAVAIDAAGHVALAYQEKTSARAGSRAPVWATTTDASAGPLAKPVQLDADRAFPPRVLAYRDGALVAWAVNKVRWGLAVERDGRFRPAAAPPGRPSDIGNDSRDLAVAGRYAGLAWIEPDGSVRASVGSP